MTSLTNATRARRSFAILSVAILLGILLYILYIDNITSGPAYIFMTRSFNEPTKAAIDIRLNQSGNFFQIGLVLMGSIWGLIIAKKGESALVLKDYPEIFMSLSATTLLALSLLYHVLYVNTLTDIYSDAGIIISQMEADGNASEPAHTEQGNAEIVKSAEKPTAIIPDVFQDNINYMFVAQTWFLFSGMVVALITLISAHKLKEQ